MGTYDDLKQQIIGKPERHYCEFKDANNQLIDPTGPKAYVYNPRGVLVSSATPTQESTGVYYFTLTLTTAATSLEGIYQVWWEGTIGGGFITMDEPHYFYVKTVPWQVETPDEIIQSVRRLIGDTNPSSYRVSNIDMYYFLQDAVDAVNAEYPWGNSLAITNNSATFASSPCVAQKALYKLKTLLLVKESTLSDSLFDGGMVSLGDIKVDIAGTLRVRSDDIKRLSEAYDKLMYEVKMNHMTGNEINTYVTGILNIGGYEISELSYSE